MYKMVVFDVDGTLIPQYDHVLSDEIIEMFSRLKNNGYIVCLATGRDFVSIGEIHKNKNIDYFIGANGAFVYDLKNDKFIFDTSINFDEYEKFQKEVLDKNLNMIKKIVLSDTNFAFVCEVEKMNEPWFWDSFRSSFRKLSDAKNDIVRDDFHLITINFNNPEILKISEEWFAKNNLSIDIQSSWNSGFFVANKGICKSFGIKKLSDYLNIKPEEIIAFGDGENDLDMIQFVGLGVAMENAVDELKDIAKDVTTDVNECGTKDFLEKKGFI